LPRTPRAAEAEIGRGEGGGFFAPRGRAVAGAVRFAADEGASAGDALGHAGFGRVEAVGRTGRIFARALHIIVGAIPIGSAFPDVAGHVEEAVVIGAESPNGCAAHKSIRRFFARREVALPDVREPISAGCKFAPPHKWVVHRSATRGVFPLGLGRQTFASPS